MATKERSGTPADVAAERAAIEAEIEGSTLLSGFAQTVAAAGDAVAHRWLEDGQWRSLTYRQVHDQVRDVALGLGVVGLRPGEFAVIWSRNRSEATVADYAVMHAGGVPVFIYTTVSAEQAAYIAGHCEATVAIVEREFLPKLRTVREELPKLRQIIVIDGEADEAIGWPRLVGLGHAEAERAPGLFEQTWRRVTPVDLATLIYTSGTTGQPKAVMLTHRNACFYQRALARVLPFEEQADADGAARVISYLPMAHATGRTMDHWAAMADPFTLAYCPDAPRLFEIAAQVRPTALLGVPRVWEKLHAALSTALPDASPDAVRAMPEQARHAVLARIGLDQCRVATTGAAPIDPAVIEFFQGLGLKISEGWGMTELTCAATYAGSGESRAGAVGKAFPGMEVRIADDGEVLVRGPLVMRGYYKDQAGDGGGTGRRRVDAHRRRRRARPRRLPEDHRPEEGAHHHLRREEHLPGPHRVPAAAAPADRPGLRLRRPAQLRDRADRARPGGHPRLGPGARHPRGSGG